jgi:hypothetical protein
MPKKILWNLFKSPKIIIVLIVLALFLCLLSYAFLSIHVLSIGDWPHDVLMPTYGNTQIQTGWAPSLGIVPENNLKRFDDIVIDSSIKQYVDQPPWKDVFDNYVKNGGTLIIIVSKDPTSTGKIIQTTSLGKGQQIEVSGYPNATFNSLTWHKSADFWSGLYKKSIHYFRVILLQILKYACIVLALVFVFLIILMLFDKRKDNGNNAELKAVNDKVTNRSRTGGRTISGWFIERKKHILVILLLLAVSVFTYSGWMTGLQQGKIPSFEEGFLDIATVNYDINYIHEYHAFPLEYDSRTYSQPMDISAYMRTPTVIIPVIFCLTFGLSPFAGTVMTFMLCTYLFMLIIYYLVYKHTKKTLAALISALLYLAGNSFLLNTIAQGELRCIMEMFLISLVFLATDLVMNEKKWISITGTIGSLLAYLWLLGNNAVIGVICLSAAIAMWFFIYGYRKHLIKVGVLIIILITGGLGYWLFISANANLFPSTTITQADFAWKETPNFVQALALNVAQFNGANPITIALGSNHLFTFIEFLPLVFATLAMIFNRKFAMPYVIGICLILLAAAFYGPLTLLYLHIPLIFRAPGRTFLPVAIFIMVFLSGIGLAYCPNYLPRVRFKSIVLGNTVPVVLSIGIICLLIITSLLFVKSGVKSWKVPDDIENAYASIPEGSRILDLPVYGTDYYSLSSPQQNYYREDVSVGWTMLHLDVYEVNKYRLKDAYAPPSDWEVPFMTKWYFNIIDQKMTQWNDTIGAVGLLNLAPDLQYLVVYTKLTPDSVLQSLNTSDQLQKTFDSPTMTVYKRINSIEQPVLESNKAFLLYTRSYQYSLPSLTALTNGQIPVLMGQTIDKLFSLDDAKDMQNLTVTTQDTTIADIATGYAIDNTKDKTLINLAKTLKTSETKWVSSDFWQPALGQLAMSSTTPGAIHNTTFKVSGTGSYDIYVRVACNGPWRGNLEILLDGQNLGGNYSPADTYGFRWFHVTITNLNKGKHTLGFLNTETQWIDVNAIAVLNHAEYTSNFQKYSQEFQNIVAGHDYLGIYEAEDSYSNLNSAAVSDNFSQDWANYPSGGWPSGKSVEIQPASDNAITIPLDIPVSGSYYVTVKQKGTCEMITDNLHILPTENRKSDTWNYVSYFVYFAKGTHVLRFGNPGQIPVWLDTVYISNQPLSQILDHENPAISIKTINDGDYDITSSSDQPRYVTLMKSYFPLWKAKDSFGKTQTDFLTNGFLSGFYISGKTYIIQFK